MADKADVEQGHLEGERGPVTVPLRKIRKASVIAFTAIVVLSVAGAVAAYVGLVKRHKAPETKPQAELNTTEAVLPPKTFLPAPPQPGVPGQNNGAAVSRDGATKNETEPEEELRRKRFTAPLISSQGISTEAVSPKQQEQAIEAPKAHIPGSLSSSLQPTDTPGRLAGMITNRNLTIAKGTFIDCVLETRIASDVPGMTSCVVTRNIYGDNGKVLLIERGSKITGEYQSGMKQGQKRIFVLWNRIKTVHGVTVDLDSPGTDALGGSGMPGYIDNHFGERFGGAILLSVISDGLLIGANVASRAADNQTIVYNNTASNANQMAAEALRNTINIPPTLYKNQGERVNVIVARDLSFEGVYDVRLR
ncbi:MAG: Type IV secretion system protein virB10 [Syntrophorhabdus sp. PtaU1.Bin153]|nr:MAG: Type IV secretion system protein virB10 [Syntrophorhabdus sp. PtaU1.Bin153]